METDFLDYLQGPCNHVYISFDMEIAQMTRVEGLSAKEAASAPDEKNPKKEASDAMA